jgi:hypothetical protein
MSVLQGERDVIKELNKSNFPWAPKYHGSSLTFENPVGFPFITLSWIEGSPLSWTKTNPPRPTRDKVLRQVAEIQVALIECTKEDSVSAFTSAPISANDCRGYRFAVVLEADRRQDKPSPQWQASRYNCSGLCRPENHSHKMIGPGFGNVPFALDYGDLAPLNIIVDSEYNVTG